MMKEEKELRKLIEDYSNTTHYVQSTRIGRSREREIGYKLITALIRAYDAPQDATEEDESL